MGSRADQHYLVFYLQKIGKFAKIGKIHMLHSGKKGRGHTLARENYRKRKLGKKREGMEGKVKLGREKRKVHNWREWANYLGI